MPKRKEGMERGLQQMLVQEREAQVHKEALPQEIRWTTCSIIAKISLLCQTHLSKLQLGAHLADWRSDLTTADLLEESG